MKRQEEFLAKINELLKQYADVVTVIDNTMYNYYTNIELRLYKENENENENN